MTIKLKINFKIKNKKQIEAVVQLMLSNPDRFPGPHNYQQERTTKGALFFYFRRIDLNVLFLSS